MQTNTIKTIQNQLCLEKTVHSSLYRWYTSKLFSYVHGVHGVHGVHAHTNQYNEDVILFYINASLQESNFNKLLFLFKNIGLNISKKYNHLYLLSFFTNDFIHYIDVSIIKSIVFDLTNVFAYISLYINQYDTFEEFQRVCEVFLTGLTCDSSRLLLTTSYFILHDEKIRWLKKMLNIRFTVGISRMILETYPRMYIKINNMDATEETKIIEYGLENHPELYHSIDVMNKIIQSKINPMFFEILVRVCADIQSVHVQMYNAYHVVNHYYTVDDWCLLQQLREKIFRLVYKVLKKNRYIDIVKYSPLLSSMVRMYDMSCYSKCIKLLLYRLKSYTFRNKYTFLLNIGFFGSRFGRVKEMQNLVELRQFHAKLIEHAVFSNEEWGKLYFDYNHAWYILFLDHIDYVYYLHQLVINGVYQYSEFFHYRFHQDNINIYNMCPSIVSFLIEYYPHMYKQMFRSNQTDSLFWKKIICHLNDFSEWRVTQYFLDLVFNCTNDKSNTNDTSATNDTTRILDANTFIQYIDEIKRYYEQEYHGNVRFSVNPFIEQYIENNLVEKQNKKTQDICYVSREIPSVYRECMSSKPHVIENACYKQLTNKTCYCTHAFKNILFYNQ